MAATAHLTLAAPDNEKFTVQSAPARLPRRKPNAEYRSREHLTEREIGRLIKAAMDCLSRSTASAFKCGKGPAHSKERIDRHAGTGQVQKHLGQGVAFYVKPADCGRRESPPSISARRTPRGVYQISLNKGRYVAPLFV